MLFDAGLHDGVYWPNIRRFVGGAEYAARFWKGVIMGVKKRGLNSPNFVFRSTTTAASLGINLPRLLFLPHDVIRIAVSAISVIDLIYFISVFFLLMIKAIKGNP